MLDSRCVGCKSVKLDIFYRRPFYRNRVAQMRPPVSMSVSFAGIGRSPIVVLSLNSRHFSYLLCSNPDDCSGELLYYRHLFIILAILRYALLSPSGAVMEIQVSAVRERPGLSFLSKSINACSLNTGQTYSVGSIPRPGCSLLRSESGAAGAWSS